MNPARSLGPSVVAGSFPGYHWIYYVGPFLGSLLATGIYALLKAFDYTSVVLGQDSDNVEASPKLPCQDLWNPSMGFTRQQRTSMLARGMHPADIERAEAEMYVSLLCKHWLYAKKANTEFSSNVFHYFVFTGSTHTPMATVPDLPIRH